MAVAYSGTTVSAKGTSAAQATASITVSGTNPVLLIGFGIDISGGATTVNSVTFGGSGTVTLVKTLDNSTLNRCAIYCVVAPSGSGVVTLNLSASRPVQISVSLFTGADQTTPCPTADAVATTTKAHPTTVTPSNLVTGDISYGAQSHTQFDDCTGVTPSQTYLDSTTNVNMQCGYGTNTTGVTFAMTNDNGNQVQVAARIVQPAAGGASVTYPQLERGVRGMNRGMAFTRPTVDVNLMLSRRSQLNRRLYRESLRRELIRGTA